MGVTEPAVAGFVFTDSDFRRGQVEQGGKGEGHRIRVTLYALRFTLPLVRWGGRRW